MTMPTSQTGRNFIPVPVRKMDALLLRRYPLLWSSRLHFNIPLAILFVILASVSGWALKRLGMTLESENAIIAGAVFAAPWPFIMFQQERSLPEAAGRMDEGLSESYIRLGLLLIWSTVTTFTPFAFALSLGFAGIKAELIIPALVAVPWFAALVFMSPNLLWGLPMWLFAGLLCAELVGFSLYGVAIILVATYQIIMGHGGNQSRDTVVFVVFLLLIGILIFFMRRVLFDSGVWRPIGVLAVLSIPPIVFFVDWVAYGSNLRQMFTASLVLVLGEGLLLLPALPALRRQSRIALLTPEALRFFVFVMRRGG